MPKPPPTTELDFLRLTGNHAEFAQKLVSLGIAAQDLGDQAKHLCVCWFDLAKQHHHEATAALSAHCSRTVYSRAYYAAYNASKAARYLVRGSVSLKADDHAKAATDLPSDLPNVAQWSQRMTLLYEHRLRADYDNWSNTMASNTVTPQEALTLARDFLQEVKTYVNAKYGAIL